MLPAIIGKEFSVNVATAGIGLLFEAIWFTRSKRVSPHICTFSVRPMEESSCAEVLSCTKRVVKQ